MPVLDTNTRITLSRILLTTDFTQSSRTAFSYALALARSYGAQVFIAHAVTPEPRLSVPIELLPLEANPVWQDAERRLSEFVADDSLRDVPRQTVLKRGDLWDVVSAVLVENKIDLLVTGTHGRRGLSKIVMGSNAEEIYRRAPCPVLTIGPRVAPIEATDWNLQQIIFATDGSEACSRALPYALSLAEENQATLFLVQMLPLVPLQYQEYQKETALRALQALVPEEATAWCKPEFVVDFDLPANGILRAAREHDAGLIVMGVRKPAAMSAHLPWPIASQVVGQSTCPVLTVRGRQ
jgi:nucleotide-binding universal stress UspA family protein